VDTDTNRWSHWVTSPDGSPDWIWREDVIAALLGARQHGHLFVAGCKTNQGKLYAQLDHIALAQRARRRPPSQDRRTDQQPGRHPAGRAQILRTSSK
jgi:hypothetical protein